MKNFGIALLAGIIGYAITAALSYYLIGKLSSNGHDRGVEASMTSIFVYGPIGFILAFIVGYLWAKNHF
jgi:accessory gene regulator protein AgrB